MTTMYKVTLDNGIVCDVDEKSLSVIKQLRNLEAEVAFGIVGAVYAGRVTKSGFEVPCDVGSLLAVFEHEGLEPLAKDMFAEHRRCHNIASLWAGNAPGASRSFRNQ